MKLRSKARRFYLSDLKDLDPIITEETARQRKEDRAGPKEKTEEKRRNATVDGERDEEDMEQEYETTTEDKEQCDDHHPDQADEDLPIEFEP